LGNIDKELQGLELIQNSFDMTKEEKEIEVHLVLMARASQLTCEDLLKIVGIAEKGSAKVHISLGSWRVIIGVPKSFHQLVEQALWEMDYECISYLHKLDEQPTYLLGGRSDARETTSIASCGSKKGARRTLGARPL